MRRLPPLTAIEAFVQVARLGSVKAAAQELALSSPALSRRVQALERFVGRSLFERRHQSMRLNLSGEQLLARLAPAIDMLAVAIDATAGTSELMRLRLGVPPLFASQSLLPRLMELRTANPDLHIDIDSQPHPLARLGDGLDAAIVVTREVDPALYARRIRHSRIAAIGAKSLLDGGDGPAPEQLAGMTILVHRDLPDLFEHWRDAIGRPALEPGAVDHFDSGALMMEAAAQGLGIAFLLEEHAEQSHDDRVAALFGGHVDSHYSYWFAARRTALSNRAVRIFHDWLFETLA